MKLSPKSARRSKSRRRRLASRRGSHYGARASLHLEPLEQRQMLSVGPALLGDLNPGADPSFGFDFIDVAGTIFFVADDGTHGTELWQTDGTAAGTVMVQDLFPGNQGGTDDGTPNSSAPAELTAVGGSLFFTADDGINGRELWTSDGTEAGTLMVKDIFPGESYQNYYGQAPNSSSPEELTAVGSALFFTADDGTNGKELWTSDGTAAGTVIVKDLFPGEGYQNYYGSFPFSSSPQGLTDVDGTLFFAAFDGDAGAELFKSDGTAAGTVIVKDISPGSTYENGYGDVPDSSAPQNLAAIDGKLFFAADDGVNGQELWTSDGTAAGTVMVKDIAPGSTYQNGYGDVPDSSSPQNLTDVGGTLFFTADDGANGEELWKSDGTDAGTVIVKDLFPGSSDNYFYNDPYDYGYVYGPNSSAPQNLTGVGGTLFFTADDGVTGQELWTSDGSVAGTVIVKDIFPGTSYQYYGAVPNASYPQQLTVVDGTLHFAADDGTNGRELWMSDGTTAGTFMVADLNPGATDSYPYGLADVNGTLFFAADDGQAGFEPWTHQPITVADFGSVAGNAFDDLNGNGVRDAGEGDAEGVTIFIDANDNWSFDAGEITTVTDVDGRYSLSLPPGTYKLRQDIPADVVQTLPTNPTEDPVSYTVTVELTDELDGFDFGTYTLVVPEQPDLLPESDTGSADDDNVTRLNNATPESALQISVGGVADGAWVFVYADGQQIGLAVAEAGTAVITTAGNSALADGTHEITAVQFVGGQIGDPSAAFQLTIDTTAPAPIDTTAPSLAQAGQPYVYNADSPDEGAAGITYALVGAPAGATIDDAGAVTWTPTEPQMGPQSFEIRVTDLAGNFSAETVETLVLGVIPAHADAYPVDEDQPLTADAAAGVLANDGDANSGTLTATLQTAPQHGTVDLQPDGSFTYTPDANFFGTDGFTYIAADATDQSNEAPVTITVVSVNDPPEAVADDYQVAEDATLVVDAATGVLANDTDDENATLTATLVDQPAHGSIIFGSDGAFTYTPQGNFAGTDSFTYTANDGEADSNAATVTITVDPVNDPPEAAADDYNVNEDGVLVVDAAAGLLANDTDADDAVLTAAVVDGPANGILTLDADGSFTYTPQADFFGVDTFSYQASDGADPSLTTTVTIDVLAQADPPVAADDQFEITQDSSLQTLDVLNNDTTEPDGVQTLRIIAVSAGSAGGTVNIAGDELTVEYTPLPGFIGTETFTYTIEDGDALTEQAAVTVVVTEFVPDSTVSGWVYCDTNGNGQHDAGEIGVPGVILTLTGVDDQGTPVHIMALTAADGSYIFEQLRPGTYKVTETHPAAMVAEEDLISTPTFATTADEISDIVLTGDSHSTENNFSERGLRPQFVSLRQFLASTPSPSEYLPEIMARAEETAGNTELAFAIRAGTTQWPFNASGNAPVAVDDAYTVSEDNVLTVEAATGTLLNDTDVDGDPLTALLATGPDHGTLTLSADGSFSYTPNADFFGTDSFQYWANDGLFDSNLGEVTITVEPVNEAPVAGDDAYVTSTGVTLAVDAPAGLLANDSDGDGDPLTAALVSGPAGGTLTVDADGSFDYTPDVGFHGTDQFTYRAGDGLLDSNNATVTIVVDAAPVAADDSYEVAEDETLTVLAADGVVLNDTDADGDTLTASLLAGASNGTVTLDADGSFIYTPDAQFHGTDSFTYTIGDGLRDSNEATVTIIVTEQNDPPAAVDDSYGVPSGSVLAINAAGGVLANDSDPDGNALTAVAATDPAHGALTFHADGSFTYTPDAAFHGTDSFTYRATDGLLDSNDATVTILVNSPPATTGDSHEVAEEATLTVVALDGVLANDSDPDGNNLTVSLVSGPSHGTAALAADGSFIYTPETDFNGTDVFTYRADDGFVESGETTVTIAVTAVDDAPVAFAQSRSLGEDLFAEIAITGDDGDPELDQSLLFALATTPLHGTLSGFDPNTGAVTYTPDLHYNGPDSFGFTVGDGTSISTEATVSLNVTETNDPPAAVDDAATTEEDVPVVIDVLTNDTDDDPGDVLVVESVTQGAFGAVVINGDGTLTYSPEIGLDGTDQFTYTLSDGNGGTDTATVDVTITPAADVPLIVAGHHTLLPNQAGQEIEVLISGGHPIEGMNFYIQVADGGPEAVDLGLIDPPGIDGPHVENVDLETGTIFAANHTGQVNPGAHDSLPQLFDAFIVTASATVTADGLLATVTIDTTGFTSGTWELRVRDMLAGDTDIPFVGARFQNGSITIDVDPALTDPTFATLEDVTLLAGSPLIVPLDGFDPDGEDLTYTVAVSQGALLEASIPQGNRSLRISVTGFGEMIGELHDNLVPAVTDQIVAYAEAGLYDGTDFHRVIDGFMIQGGITSVTAEFDDLFHVDLQHNRGGVFSMAKAGDDTNTSQFFITEVATRWLDFNHSIFAQLVEGDAVREAIAGVATGGGDVPFVDVVMESVDVFIDKENGLLMLKAPEGITGETDVTVTVTDESQHTYQQTFHVTVAVDTENGGPFLAPIAMQQMLVDTVLQFQLSATDVENDVIIFEGVVPSGVDYTLEVNPQTGLVTFIPASGFVGEVEIQVQVTPVGTSSFFDSQTVKIVVSDPVAASDAVLASEGSWI